MVKVFISYAREDYERADRIVRDLQRPGIDPFIDRERLKLGLFRSELQDEIRASDFFLALLSHESLHEKREVQKEWDFAVETEKEKNRPRIQPVLLEDIAPALQRTDAYGKVTQGTHVVLSKDYRKNMAYLLRMLLAHGAAGAFRETFSAMGCDHLEWDFGGWELSDVDHTGHGSQSLHARANPTGFVLRPSETHRAAIAVDTGSSNHLEYWRKLHLKTANIFANSGFRVVIDDGDEHTIEETVQGTFGEHVEDWTKRSADLSTFRGRTITLRFVVSATDQMSVTSFAEAWIDDIRIAQQA